MDPELQQIAFGHDALKERGTRIKRFLSQSDYITAAWAWFMVLVGKADEPVLVISVLYASVKLLPIVHFPPQFDVAVFIAQFVALDIGGLRLNKLADQARKDGNEDGAKHARRLSIALVGIMLAGVIMAGVDQQAATLALYSVRLSADQKEITEVKSVRRLETHFRSPQMDLWQFSDTEWLPSEKHLAR